LSRQTTLFFIFLSLITPSLFSQKDVDRKTYFNHLLKDVDSIEVVCLQNKDTAKFIFRKQNEIRIFIKMITGRQDIKEVNKNNKKGYLVYYQGCSSRLKVDLLDTGIRYYYKKESITSLSTYQADMLFMEACSPAGFNIKE
jgi:hypothetical protein